MRRIILLLLVTLSGVSRAENVETIGGGELFELRSVIGRYFERKENYRAIVGLHDSGIKGFSAALIVLDAAEPHIYDPQATMHTRIRLALGLVPHMLFRARLTSEQREVLLVRLAPFLRRYHPPGSIHSLLVRIYGQLGLPLQRDISSEVAMFAPGDRVLRVNFSERQRVCEEIFSNSGS